MSRILVQAPFEERLREIQECLNPLHIGVLKSRDKNSSTAFIKYEAPLMYVIDSFHLTKSLLSYLDQLRRSIKYDRPLILVLDDAKDAFSVLKNKKNVHVIDRNEMEERLPRLIEKLLQKPNLTKQLEQRFETSTALNIECVEDGRDLDSIMTNLSTSGAFVEFDKDPNLTTGALLRLKVRLQEVNSSHNMHAEVVWTKKDPKSGRTGCGVRFINEQAMYKALMSRI